MKAHMKFTPEQRAKIVEEYISGATAAELVAKYGCSHSYPAVVAYKRGLKREVSWRRPWQTTPAEWRLTVAEEALFHALGRGGVLSRDDAAEAADVTLKSLNALISRLRGKLPERFHIETLFTSGGYRMRELQDAVD